MVPSNFLLGCVWLKKAEITIKIGRLPTTDFDDWSEPDFTGMPFINIMVYRYLFLSKLPTKEWLELEDKMIEAIL